MEKIIRQIERKRGERIFIHEYTTVPEVLSGKTPLLGHMAKMFTEGVPERPSTGSQMNRLLTQSEKVLAPQWTVPTKNAGYRGYGSSQHRIVQDYFWANVKGVIGTEVPVYDDEATGMMDFLIAEPEALIILDFKPDLIKCLPDAMSQLKRYREMLHKNTMIPRSFIQCYAFDENHCYKLIS